MDTLSYKTISANNQTVERKWYIFDAEDQIVGRFSTEVATILRGKHKPNYTPHVDCGDNIIIINASKVRFTGKKMRDKVYTRYSGYPGGLKKKSPEQYLTSKTPNFVVEHAVKGMLPKTKLGNAMRKKLFVYAGEEHPHGAQKPEILKFK